MKPDPEDLDPQTTQPNPAPELPGIDPAPPAPEPAPPPDDGTDPEAPYGRKADGTPRAKPGRKKAADEAAARLESVTPAPPRVTKAVPIAAPAPIAASVDYKALGETAATLWFNVPQPLLGEEWGPNEGEPRLIADAFSRYFKSTGVSDIPPGMALALVLTSYTMARLTKPTIKDRFVMGFKWLMSRVKR